MPAGIVDSENKACLMKVCSMYLGIRDTNLGLLSTGKVTCCRLVAVISALGSDKINTAE